MHVALAYVSLMEWARTEDAVHGWGSCAVVRNFRAPFQLPPVTKESRLYFKWSGCFDLWPPSLFCLIFLKLPCLHAYDLRFPFFFICLLHFQGILLLQCLSFLTPPWAWVVTTLGVRFSNPWWTERSSPLAIPPWRRLAKGFLIASPLPWRGWRSHTVLAQPLTSSLNGEPVPVTTILPPSISRKARRSGGRDVKASPRVWRSHSVLGHYRPPCYCLLWVGEGWCFEILVLPYLCD